MPFGSSMHNLPATLRYPETPHARRRRNGKPCCRRGAAGGSPRPPSGRYLIYRPGSRSPAPLDLNSSARIRRDKHSQYEHMGALWAKYRPTQRMLQIFVEAHLRAMHAAQQCGLPSTCPRRRPPVLVEGLAAPSATAAANWEASAGSMRRPFGHR
jgi:hypothetical protein